MTAVTSSIHAARTAIVAGLQTHPDLNGVRVTYGPPLPNPPGEYVWVGDARSVDEESVDLGARRRREEYRIDVNVSVYRKGQDMAAAAERAYTLASAVADYVRANPTLSATYTGPELIDVVFAGVQRDELAAADQEREARIVAGIRVRARI